MNSASERYQCWAHANAGCSWQHSTNALRGNGERAKAPNTSPLDFVNVILCHLKLYFYPCVLAPHDCHVRHHPYAGPARLKGSGSGRHGRAQ